MTYLVILHANNVWSPISKMNFHVDFHSTINFYVTERFFVILSMQPVLFERKNLE